MIFKPNKGKFFSQELAIDLMISWRAIDINSDRTWKGFYNSLSKTELKAEWNEYWKDQFNQIK